jgi:hypothetical protein
MFKGEIMEQTILNLNWPKPSELFKYGSQNYRVYEQLCAGGVTTSELMDMRIACHTHRISDNREKLKPYGLTVVCEPISNSNNIYKIKEIPASRGADKTLNGSTGVLNLLPLAGSN